MKRREVVLAPEAIDDLGALFDWIASAAGEVVARGYIDRIERYCFNFDMAGERGLARDDIRPGLRIIGFERRITLAFSVGPETVTILRVFYGGQDWTSALT